MQAETTSRAFRDWMRFRRVEPTGPIVTAWQIAICASAVIQALTGEEVDATKLMVDPFGFEYEEAVLDGDIDDDLDTEETAATKTQDRYMDLDG